MTEQGNLEVAREAYRALTEGDIEAMLALCDPDVEFVSRVTDIEGGAYRGLDGVREWWTRLFDVFPSIEAEILEVVADEGDCMVVRNRLTGRARGSGMEVEQSWFQAARLRDGQWVWWGFYDTADEALEAVGLR